MIEAKYIKAKDLDNLTKDKNGNYLIPENIKIYIEEDAETKRLKRIVKIETELTKIKEPNEKELIQEGKMMHPYYMLNEELEYLKKVVE